MRGITAKKTKPAKLRRPQGISTSDVHGGTSNNPADGTAGTGNAGEGAGLAPASAGHTDPLADYPVGLDKIYFRTRGQGDADLEEAIQVPLQHEPAIRTILNGQLVEQAGGLQNISPTLAGLLGTIVEQRILETKINRALARHGSLRVNNKTGRVSGQAIIKDLLLPLQASLRLNLKQYADECERIRQGGRGGAPYSNAPLFEGRTPYEVDLENGTPEDDLAKLNELNRILGHPEQTHEDAITQFKSLYQWPPPTDGSPPIPLRRGQ